MTRRSRIGTPGLLLRHFASNVTASALVALLVFLTVFVVALAPRALAILGTEELHYELGRLSPLERDLVGVGFVGIRPPTEPRETAADILGPADERLRDLPDRLPPVLSSMLGEPSWYVTTAPRSATPRVLRSEALPVLALAIDLEWLERIRFVDGAAPAPWEGSESDDLDPVDRPPIDIALSQDATTKLGLELGDILDYPGAPLRLAGVYEAIDPQDPYWLHAPGLLEGVARLSDFRLVVQATAYLDPESSVGLYDSVMASRLTVWYPVDGDVVDYADVPKLQREIDQTLALGESMSSSTPLELWTGFPDAVDATVARVTSVSALLALTASGPIGVVLAVFALGVQSVIDRRRTALALASARGAGSWSLRGAMLLEGLLIAGPAAVLAIVLAGILLPARIGTPALLLPAVLALVPPVLLVATATSVRVKDARSDASVRSTSRRRWVIEAIVVGLAALSLFLLARRGLVATSAVVGIDPLLAATPLLLSVSVCLLVLRFVPVPLVGLLRTMRRRRGAVGLLGAARAVRAPALGFAAALALVVGISVAVFSVVMSTTVTSALRDATDQELGADLRVEAVRLGPAVVEAVDAVPGVLATTGIQLEKRAPLKSRTEAEVDYVLVDPEAMALIRPDLPPGLDAAGSRIPVLISADLADRFPLGDATLEGQDVTIIGTIPSEWLPGLTQRWVLAAASHAERLTGAEFSADDLLVAVDEGVDPASVAPAIRELVVDVQREIDQPAVRVYDTTTQLGQARAAPTIAGLESALLLAVLASLLLSVLTVVVASVTAAASRNRIVGVMRTLGMSPRQVTGLILWELGPVAVTAVVAGTALGLVLPWIVTSALDLRPFVGGLAAPTPTIDPLLVAGTAVGFILVVALAGAIAVAIGRRLDPSSILRMGAE